MIQSIGLVDSHLIDHCSAIFDDHVEKVVGLPCFQAMLANLQVKSCIHVHRSGLDLSTILWLPSLINDLTAARGFRQVRQAENVWHDVSKFLFLSFPGFVKNLSGCATTGGYGNGSPSRGGVLPVPRRASTALPGRLSWFLCNSLLME
ncbi:hypothetical protein EMIT0P253_10230 [Pseudomonas sp. IT-P253]